MPHVWKRMPVTELINDAGEPADAKKTAERMVRAILGRGGRVPGLYLFRIVWTRPSTVAAALELVRAQLRGTQIEVLDPHSFFDLFRRAMEQAPWPPALP